MNKAIEDFRKRGWYFSLSPYCKDYLFENTDRNESIYIDKITKVVVFKENTALFPDELEVLNEFIKAL